MCAHVRVVRHRLVCSRERERKRERERGRERGGGGGGRFMKSVVRKHNYTTP